METRAELELKSFSFYDCSLGASGRIYMGAALPKYIWLILCEGIARERISHG